MVREVYELVKYIVTAYEPNSVDEFYWMDKLLEQAGF